MCWTLLSWPNSSSQPIYGHIRWRTVSKHMHFHAVVHNLFVWIITFKPKKSEEVSMVFTDNEAREHICYISAMTDTGSLLNGWGRLTVCCSSLVHSVTHHWGRYLHVDPLNRIQHMSGPFSVNGKHQHSCCGFFGCASSACSASNIVCMNLKCSFISGFLSRVCQRDSRRLAACRLLLGRLGLFGLKGNGATHELESFM